MVLWLIVIRKIHLFHNFFKKYYLYVRTTGAGGCRPKAQVHVHEWRKFKITKSYRTYFMDDRLVWTVSLHLEYPIMHDFETHIVNKDVFPWQVHNWNICAIACLMQFIEPRYKTWIMFKTQTVETSTFLCLIAKGGGGCRISRSGCSGKSILKWGRGEGHNKMTLREYWDFTIKLGGRW